MGRRRRPKGWINPEQLAPEDRFTLVLRLRRALLRRGLPRFQMSLIVVTTGLVGFGASVGLLAAGMVSMPLRYGVAVAIAYATFLLLVRLWAVYQRRSFLDDLPDVDIPLPDIPLGGGSCDAAVEPGFGGGEFGGGGAGRSWDLSLSGGDPHASVLSSGSGGGSSGSLPDVDLDDGWMIVVPIVLALGTLAAAVYVIYIAPALLAEVLLDVLLVSGLYRGLRGLERRHWLSSVFRRTWLPVTGVLVLSVALGYGAQHVRPNADSIGDLFRRQPVFGR
jgi:hypothetical protein